MSSATRLPSPLRPLVWDGEQWVAGAPEPPRSSPSRYSAEAIEQARRTWRAWAVSAVLGPDLEEPATVAAVDYLQLGLPADVVAALVLSRLGRAGGLELSTVEKETAHVERVIKDLPRLVATAVITKSAAEALEEEYARRLDALRQYGTPLLSGVKVEAERPAREAALQTPAPAVTRAAGPPAPPPPPPGPAFSLREVFAEHSVLVLAALGAFLLVVATVLFELYGTIGLGGGARLGAVVALAALFAVAGFLARRRPGLESVGQIYIALAAVLLPLIGLAAWTFLDLGASGITVYQALGITALACAGAYGFLAEQLELRPYGTMAGLAVVGAAIGLAGWIAGDEAVPVGLALTPLVYGLASRLLSARPFVDLHWFAHAAAVLALGDALRFSSGGWLWTETLATMALAYLAWNAVAHQPLRAWIGEAAAILAATAATGPLGLDSYQFALPLATAVPLVALSRASDTIGGVLRAYRPHAAHLHGAVVAGLVLATAESIQLDTAWPLAVGLSLVTGLYAFDYGLAPTVLTGVTLRAAALLALAATGRAAGFGAWTASLTALGLVAFAIPFASGRFNGLRQFASYFYYGGLLLVAGELYDAEIGLGDWAVPAALAMSAFAFAAAAELGARVRFAAFAARTVFSLAWFASVNALGAGDWRGPFDALLAPFYVALAQARALAHRSTATAGRRWLVHAVAVASLALSVNGPSDAVWWRLTATAGTLAAAYWWLATVRREAELPWLAWLAVSLASAALSLAVLNDAWAGAGIAASAIVLTAGWSAGCRRLPWRSLDEAGLAVLTLLSATGMSLAAVEGWLEWPQVVATLCGAVFFAAWSVLDVSQVMKAWRPMERCTASLLCLGGLASTAAVLRLDMAALALGVIPAAALHAEWTLRTREPVERWYAIVAVLAAAPAIYFWPYSNETPLLVALELVVLAVLIARTAVRSRHWWLAGAAVLALAPALAMALAGFDVHDRHLEEASFVALAWIAGFAGLLIRTRYGTRWALSTEAGAAAIAAATLLTMAVNADADQAGVSLMAFSVLLYVAAAQERSRAALPFAPAAVLAGMITLLGAHGADTIYYAAALGVVGLAMWMLGLAVDVRLGRGGFVDVHRYVGLGLLTAAGLAGFGFPDKTGPATLGAVLATFAFVVTGAVLFLDARRYAWRPNQYLAIVAAATGAFFAARFVNLDSWELVGPGLGLIVTGVAVRHERAFQVGIWQRRLVVAAGLGLVFGWATALTVTGDIRWLVTLLVEGTLAVTAGVAVRNRVLLAGGGGALVLSSLRALLLIAQAGYLFIAFGAVALVLLAGAAALALGRQRYLGGAREAREQISSWD